MVHTLKTGLASIIAQHGVAHRSWLELNPEHDSILKTFSGLEAELILHDSNPHVERIDCEDGSLGSVFTFGTIERHPNHIELLQEVSRVLQPYGRLLGAIPLHNKIRSLRVFTPDKLRSELRFCGFRGIHIYKIRHEAILPLMWMPFSFQLLKITSPLTVLPHWLMFTATKIKSD